MVARRVFAVALLAAIAQSADVGSEKAALVSALRGIENEARRFQEAHPNDPITAQIASAARWLANAASNWSPKKSSEGQMFLESAQRMLQAIRSAPRSGNELDELLRAIEEDLSTKESHCRVKGLAVPQRVAVVTKRKALEEVKGLEVLYIEKFLQHDVSAKPHQFRQFSSPAVDDLVPGRYVFWAKEPDGQRRSGERKEARVGNGLPKEPIEVLAF